LPRLAPRSPPTGRSRALARRVAQAGARPCRSDAELERAAIALQAQPRKSTAGVRITRSNCPRHPRLRGRDGFVEVPIVTYRVNSALRGAATPSGSNALARARQQLQQSRDRHSHGSTDNTPPSASACMTSSQNGPALARGVPHGDARGRVAMRSKSRGRWPFHRIGARGGTHLENPLKVETRVQIPLGLPTRPSSGRDRSPLFVTPPQHRPACRPLR
jgi:hypothetical protein